MSTNLLSLDNLHTTASENVQVIHHAFVIPGLNRTRRIWLYLPPGYHRDTKKYPVIYMHDGQNLFDAHTSYCGEWGIDKQMNTMEDPCIIVGIDNAGMSRMNEYNFYDHEEHGKAEGMQYLTFVAKTLKPFIDRNYRTKKTAKHTLMAGSSMGGLITFYAGLHYPDVFGTLGIFSPSFWINPFLKMDLPVLLKKQSHRKQRFFFHVGGQEHPTMVNQMLEISTIVQQSKAVVKNVIIPEGQHTESDWGMAFGRFYRWQLGE